LPCGQLAASDAASVVAVAWVISWLVKNAGGQQYFWFLENTDENTF
jgi:hypothetical protein